MRIWELEGGLAVLFFVLLVPVVLAPFVHRIYRDYGRFAGAPAALAMALGLYGCALVAFTLFPLPAEASLQCTKGALSNYWQLTPLSSLDYVLDEARRVGLAATLTSGFFLQVVMNVVFFVPLGLFASYRGRLGIGRTLVLGFGVSLLIEATQGTGIWWLYDCPYRLADVDDLITNTAGTAIGWAIGTLLSRRLPFVSPEPVTDLGRPSLRRRVGSVVTDLVVVGLVHFVLQLGFVGALLATGSQAEDIHVQGVAHLLLVVVGGALLLAMPLVRHDRATPGAWALWLGLARASSETPADVRAVLVRFGVRWLPWILTASPLALIAVLAVEGLTVAVRRDRRSLSAVLAGTDTVTRRSLEAAAAPPSMSTVAEASRP
jgi:glycopeptide antibiotics resistance protein